MASKLLMAMTVASYLLFTTTAQANETVQSKVTSEAIPWGVAEASIGTYEPQKVVYDLTTGDEAEFSLLLSRVAFLYKMYDSDAFDTSIVVVIHGDAIPFFATANLENLDLMKKAYSTALDAPIEYRMCEAAAGAMGFEPKDIHGFVKMVPMADAEIIKLQKKGYAYMH